MSRVTVIIPVYKVEPWLPACLDSVLAQTLRDLDVICVDDASPDGCPAILDAYAARDPRVSVIHLAENRGQGNGRNLGLERAQGKYVYFLDSDDMIEPEAMEALADRADAEALDGIFFDSRVIFEDAALARRHASYPAARTGSYPHEAEPGLRLFERFIAQQEWTCYVQRQFWNRAFLLREGIRFPVRVEHEDEVFAFEAVLAAARVLYWAKPFFIRRYRADSVMTAKPAPKNFHGYFMDYCHMQRFARDRGLSGAAIDKNLARLYEKMVRYYRDMHETEDLESLFSPGPERDLFTFFAGSQRADVFYDGLLQESLTERLRGCGPLYIYGAGVLAGQVYRALERQGFVTEGFLVTDAAGNPAALYGHAVRPFAKAVLPADAMVLIAVTDGYRAEIEAALDARGLTHVYYREN